MASIAFLEKRIAGKEKELDKLNKKLARIRKVEAQNWEDPNPYYYSVHDLSSTLRSIEEVQASLATYNAQYTAELEKAASRNVPAIVEFLNGWRERMFDYYKKGLEEFYAEKLLLKDLRAKISQSYYLKAETPEQIAYETAREAFYNKCHGYYEKKEFTNRWEKLDYTKVKIKDGEYEWLMPYSNETTLDKALVQLNKHLDLEWTRKYDFIIERTNQIVGQITDASNLYVGNKQDLNGYIIGTRGTAKVQTIGAGGYNIQCFHFRTLISRA